MEDNNDYLRRELKIPASGDEGLEGDLSESSPVPEDRIKMSRRKLLKLGIAGSLGLLGFWHFFLRNTEKRGNFEEGYSKYSSELEKRLSEGKRRLSRLSQ